MVGVGHQGRERLGYSEAVERPHGRLVEAHEHPIVQHGLFECGVHDVPPAQQSPKRRARARGFALGHFLTAAVASEDATASAASALSSYARLADAASPPQTLPSTAFVGRGFKAAARIRQRLLQQRPLPLARERRD